MQAENALFLFSDADRHLFDSSGKNLLTPDKIDYEMSFGKSRSVLHIRKLSQDGLEHFVQKYGAPCRILVLNDCRGIADFSPLGDLPALEAIKIEWCRKTDRLWNMSRNGRLKVVSVSDARQIVRAPELLSTSHTLEEIRLWGAADGHSLSSLECFRGMESLRRIDLNRIRLEDHSTDVLHSLPKLEEFHFDAGMLTTEEIAWICARYPKLYGQCLRAYTTEDAGISDVRVCGFRKPGLNLPKDQKRLERYAAEFMELVRKYSENI